MGLFQDLWSKLSGDDADAAGSLDQDEVRLASAALLVHAAKVDGQADRSEMNQISWLLKERFTLSDSEAADLLQDAETTDENAVDLYGFTSVLKRHLDQDDRQAMVRMLWEIVFADRELDKYEDNLVWRVEELIVVSARDRIELRREVEAERG